MARDYRTTGIKSGQGTRIIRDYVSGWSCRETGGSATATIKLRDSLKLPLAVSAVDSGGGTGPDTGLHYYMLTWATPHDASATKFGESLLGAQTGTVTTASNHATTVTLPTYTNLEQDVVAGSGSSSRGPYVYGRRLYRTKAGAPAAASVPTSAQWFLVVADTSLTVAAGSTLAVIGITNSPANISVNSTTGLFPTTNANVVINTASRGPIVVQYASLSGGNTLVGCTVLWPNLALFPSGIPLVTGDVVYQPMIGDNTTTSYTDSVTDANLTATAPPTKDTAGELVDEAIVNASEAGGPSFGGPNIDGLFGDGGLYVELGGTGALSWHARGQ